jgi:hypothetical protein
MISATYNAAVAGLTNEQAEVNQYTAFVGVFICDTELLDY